MQTEPYEFPSYPPESLEEETANNNPYASKQEALAKRKEQLKDSHKPKKPVEEFDNVEIPQVIKNKLVTISDELLKRNKENRAIAYAMSIANDTIEKLQVDLAELTEVVKDFKSNSNVYMMQDEDEKLLSKDYDSTVDIDIITGNVLRTIEDRLPKIPNSQAIKKGKFGLAKKELIIYFILLLLVISNSYFNQFINKILSFGNKEALTSEYRIKKGDFGVCTTKNDSNEKKISLKEDSKLNVAKDNDGKIWFMVGDYYCYVDSAK